MNYDFLNLSSYEFENLSRDLLQKKLNVVFESFTSGRDGGIDLRHSKNLKNEIIVQCKRYTTYSSLYSNLKKEVRKVKKINPKRYIITTSVGLTPKQKENILALFDEYIIETGDIVGRDELNNLLCLYEDIEKKHFKLWLSSTTILKKIIHSKIYNQTSFEEEIIKENIKTYVENESFEKAINTLNKHHYVIISGIPGIGKTTLARILVYHFLANDFDEFIYLSNSISEGFEVFEESKKQIFLFDDFLGRNFLESKLNTNEEKRIINFIDKVNKSKNKALILTTREYILNQAKTKYDLLDENKMEFAKYIIDLEDYTNLARAKILYNHLFFSDLPEEYLLDLLKGHKYISIIKHRNYNPRVISAITQKDIWATIKVKDYYKIFIEYLNKPSLIWKHAYENQISKLSRCILALLSLNNPPIFLNDLEKAVKEFSNLFSKKYDIHYNYFTFKESIKELENTFIKITKDYRNQFIVNFQNPSIQDFLIAYLENNKSILIDCIESSLFLDQIFSLFRVGEDENNSDDSFSNLLGDSTKKIPINPDLNKTIINKLLKDFSILRISSLHPVYFQYPENFYWSYNDYDLYTKIRAVIEFYGARINPKLETLLINLIKSSYPAELSSHRINWYSLNNIVEYFGKKFPLNLTVFLNTLTKQLNDVDDIDGFSRLDKTCSKIEINKDDYADTFYDNIHKIIQDETDDLNNIDDVQYYYDNIKNINDYFDLGLDEKLKELSDKIEEENQFEPEYDHENYSSGEESSKDVSDSEIYNMFDSLIR
jgi:adenylate kinase family enzyme